MWYKLFSYFLIKYHVLEIFKIVFVFFYIWIFASCKRWFQDMAPILISKTNCMSVIPLKLVFVKWYCNHTYVFYTCLMIIVLYNVLWSSEIFDICVWEMAATICYNNDIMFSCYLFIKLTFSLTMLLNMITKKKTLQLMNMWRNL